MKIQSLCLTAGLVLALAAPALAQGNDAAYCKALVGKYQEYVAGMGSGRHGGTGNVVATQRQRFPRRLLSTGTADTESEGNHFRGLRTEIVACTSVPAKMCSGILRSSSKPLRHKAEATPDTAMAASIMATMMYSRLLPVFRAAIPIISTIVA